MHSVEKYTIQDAINLFQPAYCQFIYNGAKPVIGKEFPHGYEINLSHDDLCCLKKPNGEILIVIPLLDRTINNVGKAPVRRGDCFSLVLAGATNEEAVTVANLLSRKQFDCQAILDNSQKEAERICSEVAKEMVEIMNAKKQELNESDIRYVTKKVLELIKKR